MKCQYLETVLIVLVFLTLIEYLPAESICPLHALKKQHNFGSLSNDDFRKLSQKGNLDRLKSIFYNIYKIRVPSTPQHNDVKKYIENFFNDLNWQVILDEFSTSTVDGPKEFTNIIAVKNPLAPRRLSLACHYDSKKIPNFYAASDSAVPCALLLDLAKTLDQEMASVKGSQVSLELIFFDGEEAFMDWTETDSLYGSRHLANRWLTERHTTDNCSRLDSLDLLVLLDLLGPANIKIHKFEYAETRPYDALQKIERRASQLGLLRTSSRNNRIFTGRIVTGSVGDDHQPFMEKNVPVLHIIPLPFSSTWHTDRDTDSNVSWDSVMDLDLIFKAFVLEYFDVHL